MRSFPNNLTAKMFGYQEISIFSVENEAEISKPPRVDFGTMPASASGVSNYRKTNVDHAERPDTNEILRTCIAARVPQLRCHWLKTHWTSVWASSGEIGPPRSADSGIDMSPQCALPPSLSLFSSMTSALRLLR